MRHFAGPLVAVARRMRTKIEPPKPNRRPRAGCSGVLTALVVLFASTHALAQEATNVTNSTPVSTPARLRFGVSAGVGLGSLTLGAAASARLGIQITPSVATSYQITSAITGGFLSGEDIWTSHALLIELTPPGSMFSIGGGPAIASGTRRSCAWTSDCTEPRTSKDYLGLGFDARLARTFGANRPNLRAGFTLELAVHVSPEDAAATLGIGFDIF